MSILLILFIFFIVVPLVSAMYKIWSFRRRVRRFMEDPFGQGRPSPGSRPSREAQPQRRASKKIPDDVGEYVAFTEYESHTSTESTGKKSTTVRTESQITDVEWADIEK